VVSDFHHQHAAIIEMHRRLRQDRSDEVESVTSAGERERRLTPVFGR
jgi:hypothetical protein